MMKIEIICKKSFYYLYLLFWFLYLQKNFEKYTYEDLTKYADAC